MAEKKYIVPKGSKVTIEINRKVPSPKSQVPSPKGLIKLRREDDFLPRRQKQYLRIFDAGRDTSGAEFSDFIIQPDFMTAIEDGLPVVTLPDYAARDEYLFDRDGETLFDKFYEIKRDDADLYKLTFFTDNGATVFETLDSESEYWTEKGVKLPGAEVWENVWLAPLYEGRIFRDNLFAALRFGDASNPVKVTAEYDFDAEEIADFRLKGGDALFLMPAICSFKATTLAFAVTHHVNYDLRFGLRSVYTEDQSPTLDPSETASYDYEDLYGAALYHVSLAEARAMSVYYDFDLMDYVWTDVPAEDALSDPPFPPAGPPPLGSWALTAQIAPSYPGVAGEGTLAAIVKRGNKTFYLWVRID